MSSSHPSVTDDWTADQWEAYRIRQQAACERFGPKWTKNVGAALVKTAGWHVARLREQEAAHG